jgi:hypothetical protein
MTTISPITSYQGALELIRHQPNLSLVATKDGALRTKTISDSLKTFGYFLIGKRATYLRERNAAVANTLIALHGKDHHSVLLDKPENINALQKYFHARNLSILKRTIHHLPSKPIENDVKIIDQVLANLDSLSSELQSKNGFLQLELRFIEEIQADQPRLLDLKGFLTTQMQSLQDLIHAFPQALEHQHSNPNIDIKGSSLKQEIAEQVLLAKFQLAQINEHLYQLTPKSAPSTVFSREILGLDEQAKKCDTLSDELSKSQFSNTQECAEFKAHLADLANRAQYLSQKIQANIDENYPAGLSELIQTPFEQSTLLNELKTVALEQCQYFGDMIRFVDNSMSINQSK